jgi:SAM-dependent methyltransferase
MLMGKHQNRDPWLARVRERWDSRVDWWDEMSEENAVTADRELDLGWTASALRLQPGARLLDAGCGAGQFALAFALTGCQVTAIDLAPKMVERAAEHASAADIAIDWRVGDFSALSDPDASYDAIHARCTLQFVPSVYVALKEFRRVLKPGGRLYAALPGACSPIYAGTWQRFLPDHDVDMAYIAPWDLESLLQSLGWTIAEQWGDVALKAAVDPTDETAASFIALPRQLQQTAAFTWAIVAE